MEDGLALQVKLDEIIRALGEAKNLLIALEDLSQHELDEKKVQFANIAHKARNDGVRRVSPPSRKASNRK